MNFVRTIVEGQNCLFHEIHHENDYGNDAFVELVDGEHVTGICVGMQIKSGASYCTRITCHIPFTERQATYWRNHSLGVLGVVFDPSEQTAYWVNLKGQSRGQPKGGTVTFDKSEFRRFDAKNFVDLVLPRLLKTRLRLDLERATRYAFSPDPEAHSIGVRALLTAHADTREVWDTFHRLLVERPTMELDPFVVYALAHIPWHGDIAGPVVAEAVRTQVRAQMATWDRRELLPLLTLIDENGLERGSVGQSVYAIVDLTIQDAENKLAGILFDSTIADDIRENGLYLFCFVAQGNATPVLERGLRDPVLSESATRMLEHLKEVGFFGV